MKKILKISFIVIVTVIALILILPFAFKGKITEAVKQEADKNLNAKLDFAGISLSLIKDFPDITAEIEKLTIVGIDTFKNDTLINFNKLTATLDLMSVISGNEIKIKQITFDKPRINVKVLKNGFANYDIAKEDTSSVSKSDTDSETSNFVIKLKKLEIKNGNIIYDDKETDVFTQLTNTNFILSGDMTEDFTNLNINMTADAMTVESEGIKYLNKVKTTFNSELSADLKNSVYTFKENNLKLNEIDLGFDGFAEMPDDDIKIDLTFKTKDTKFKDALSMIPAVYKTDFEGIETSGEFRLDGYVKGIYNDRNIPAYGINLLIKNAYFKYPDLPESVKNIYVDLKVDAEEGSGDNMTVNIKKASLTTAGNPFSATMFLDITAADIAMNGMIKGKINLESLKNTVPLEDMTLSGIIDTDISFKGNLSDIENEDYEKFDAKGNLKLTNMIIDMTDMPEINIPKADMYFSPQFVNLKQLDTKVGKSDFYLEGKLFNIFSYLFKDELLKGTFNLNSNYIDVDELSGTSETENNAAPVENEQNTESEIVEIPKNIDFTLNSDIKEIKYDKMIISDAEGKIIIKNGKLDMNGLNMKMLGGEVQISGLYDAEDLSKPKVDFKLKMNKISITEVVKAFTSVKTIAPVIENCVGDINADISLNSLLKKDMTPVLSSLISSGHLSSENISISGNGLLSKLASATKQNKFKSPRINDFNLDYFIDNGDLTVKPSKFKLAGTQVTLGGTQKLESKKLDLNMDMQLPKKIANKFITSISGDNSNENIDVGVKIGGTSDNPQITGLSSSLSDSFNNQIEDKIDETKKKAKEKADKIIEDAKKQANAVIAQAEKQADKIKSEARKKGQLLISEAEKQGNKLIREAKNPITKKAAEMSKKELVNQAKKQANNLNIQADKQANNIIEAAKNKADKIMQDAKKRAANY